MQSASAMTYVSSPEDYIIRLKGGETGLREKIIEDNWRYILSVVSKMIGKDAESTDEFSIALQAFNEAIDHYDSSKNDKFLPFAKLVINRRVIDYIRKSKKFSNEYPFTYFEVDDDEEKIKHHFTDQKSNFTEKIEVEEEIIKFKKDLKSFSIEISDLVKIAPKHMDSKIMCVTIAKRISEDKVMLQKIIGDKRLPINEIMGKYIVKRKTIEKYRKYIIALCLIFNSNLEVIKGYGEFLMKGVK